VTSDRAAFVEQRLRTSASKRGASVIPFIVGGHPSLGATERTLAALAGAGAPIVEVGVPFSDPIADGPVISQAMKRAIESGTTPAALLASIARVRAGVPAGIVLMVSVSIVERIGRERFVGAACDAGADGLVVPDLDLDEAPEMAACCRSRGLCMAMLVAPASSPERRRRIVEHCSGFVYLLARQGVTGAGSRASADANSRPNDAEEDLSRRVAELRSITSLPIACGFGISTRAQVEMVLRHADAAIVGSSLVRGMDGAADEHAAAASAADLLRSLSGAASFAQ